MKRAIRRQAEQNKKAKIKKIMKEQWLTSDSTIPKEERLASMMNPKNVGKLAQAPHYCRSLCCRNPRSYRRGIDKLTIQERRHQ